MISQIIKFNNYALYEIIILNSKILLILILIIIKLKHKI